MSGIFSMMEIPVDFHTGTGFINGRPATAIAASDLPWFESPDEQKERWRREEEGQLLFKRVESLLPCLTEKQELVFRLWMIGLSYRYIAKIMDTNVKTAWECLWGRKGRHGGAIRRLRKLLGIEVPKQRFRGTCVGE